MTAVFNWVDMAQTIDTTLDSADMADYAKLDAKEQEGHPVTKMLDALASEVRRAKAREAVEAARREVLPFVVMSENDIQNLPSPQWLVEGLIQESTICMLAGPGGLGKSFLALGIARAMASGGPFFGKKTQQGKTLYVVGEGAAAFGDRTRAWDEAHPTLQVPADGIAYVTQGVNLKDPASVETLATMVKDGDYSLVILDTLSQLAYLDNENNNAEVALTFRAIKSIRDAREGTTVLVLDHTPVNGGKVRGATSKRDNSDTVIMAIPVGERGEDGFSLSTQNDDGGKQKDGAAFAWHGFALQSVGKSAIVVNNGGKRPMSPYWEKCLKVLQTGPQSASQLRDACGIEGDMRTGEGKRLGREVEHWLRDELITKSDSKTRPVYSLSAQAEAVLA